MLYSRARPTPAGPTPGGAAFLLTTFWFALCACGIARAQTAPLEWRWDAGEATSYTLIERMDQVIDAAGIKNEIKWTREIGFTDTVLTLTDQGYRIRRSFEYVAVTARTSAGETVSHDTRKSGPQDADHTMVSPFIALEGESIEFTVGPEGKVSDLQGASEALDAMHAALIGPAAGAGVSGGIQAALGVFSGSPDRDTQLTRQLEQSLRLIPGRDVRRGEVWEIPIDHATPLGGSLQSRLNASLKRVDTRRDLAEINLEGSLTLDSVAESQQAHGLVSVLGVSLEQGDFEGHMTFNTKDRRIESAEMALMTLWTIGGGGYRDGTAEAGMRQSLSQRASLTRRSP